MNCVTRKQSCREAGAALPTVLLVTFLLVTASIALITATTSNSKNTTDALSETKAYYAAESGIQAAVNILRNQTPVIDYRDAVNRDGGTLVYWQPVASPPWTAPIDGTAGYSLGSEGGGYTIRVSDPDNSQTEIAFSTDTTDTFGNSSSGFSLDAVTFQPTLKIDRAAPDPSHYATIEWVPNTPNPTTPIRFLGASFVTNALGSFKLTYTGNGAPMKLVHFRINLRLAAPDNPTWVIKGRIETTGAVIFTSSAYRMVGSDIWLCASTGTCPSAAPAMPVKPLSVPASGASALTSYAVRLTPKEPQRLLIKSTGYGPGGARKKLEAIIQKSVIPMVPPAAGILMNGPNAVFDNGNGRPSYNGCDPDHPTVCVPSIGVSYPGSLPNVTPPTVRYNPPQGCPSCPNPYPPPAVVGEDLPDWQKTPALLDQQINWWRTNTPTSSIIANNGNLNTGQFGTLGTGRGMTFCDGNCSISGEGGGILIVRGKLTTIGGVSFRGMIIVVGTEGILRNGNGGADDQIIGAIIVAPYILTPAPNGTWLTPHFHVNGGGTSNVTYSGLDYLFDGGITGATNFVSGIAEK
ncbi:MAG TPA: hypothetical protein VMZ26_08465 [Pyrinomonadaceae bacterium]|nr:hypothetical protein [Pyrinomonadaceae bacterium]